MENNIEFILTIALILVFAYFLDQTMFYRMEKKICKTYGGNCEICCCWSCKKKEIENEKKKINKGK